MKKRTLSAIFPILMILFLGYFSPNARATYSLNWWEWSQGGSKLTYPSTSNGTYAMQKNGCHLVAHCKLMAEAGIVDPATFNPDNYFEWMLYNGYILGKKPDGTYAVGERNLGAGMISYAASKGATIERVKSVYLSGKSSTEKKSLIQSYINNGYYVILDCPSHETYIVRDKSLQMGTPWISDSSSKHTTAPMYEYKGYANGLEANFQTAYVYSVGVGRASKPIVSTNGQNVTVSWNPVSNASYYNVYLITEPWRWEDIKYTGNTSNTSYTFTNVNPNSYRTFVIARPNPDTAQSEWTDVVVQKSPSASLELDQTNITMQNGTCVKLNATTIPAGQKVSWSSTNPSVASIDSNGVVTAHKEGTAAINANMTYNGQTYFSMCTVKVTEKEDVIPKITINKSRLEITDTTSDRLTASTTPGGQSVSWSSSDSKVAKVSNGVVTGVKAGTATITASMRYNGATYSARCSVTVAASKPVETPAPAASGNTSSNEAYRAYINASDRSLLTKHKYCSYAVSMTTGEVIEITRVNVYDDKGKVGAKIEPGTSVLVYPDKTKKSSGDRLVYVEAGSASGYVWDAYISSTPGVSPKPSESGQNNSTSKPTANNVSLPVDGASSVTQTTARVDASCSYSGTRPSSVGLYLGTSRNSMSRWGSDNINHNKNPFDIWYNLDGLSAGTTYYYQFYAIVDGKTYTSETKNFTTKKEEVVTSISLPVSGASGITETTARVDASCSYTGTRPSSVGLYLGTSRSNMSRWGSDNINHNKNPFDIWYNLDGLSTGTTYYYQFYAIVDGRTYTSETRNFTTQEEVKAEDVSQESLLQFLEMKVPSGSVSFGSFSIGGKVASNYDIHTVSYAIDDLYPEGVVSTLTSGFAVPKSGTRIYDLGGCLAEMLGKVNRPSTYELSISVTDASKKTITYESTFTIS